MIRGLMNSSIENCHYQIHFKLKARYYEMDDGKGNEKQI